MFRKSFLSLISVFILILFTIIFGMTGCSSLILDDLTGGVVSSDANLEKLVLSDGQNSIPLVFNKTITEYQVTVASTVSIINVKPTLSSKKATLKIGGIVTQSDVTVDFVMVTGTNTLEFAVTAQDKVTVKKYTVNVIKQGIIEDSAKLKGLSINVGVLSPVFDKNVFSYTVAVDNTVDKCLISAETEDSTATYTINANGGLITLGSQIALNVGNNDVTIDVVLKDKKESYKLVINRATPNLSNNANLSSLSFDNLSISPIFDKNTVTYQASVGNAVTSTKLSFATDFNTATAIVKKGTELIVSPYNISLTVGDNPIDVEVTAEDGKSKKTYTIVVNRATIIVSNNANLSSLSLSSGSITFNKNTLSYNTTVVNSVSSVTLTAKVEDSNATIKINDVAVNSNVTSPQLPLNVGDNTITVIVTAEDQTTQKVYTIVIKRESTTVTGIKLHFKRPSGWTKTPKLHHWTVVATPVVANTTWPGVAMTDEGNGYFGYTIPNATSSNIIFNNDASPQTVDLSRTASGEYWYYSADLNLANYKWYTEDQEKPKTPVIVASPEPKVYVTAQAVTLTGSNTGDKIYYTVDGSTPTTSSLLYNGAISVSQTTTIKAFGVNTLSVSGSVYSFTYVIDFNADLEAPTIVANNSIIASESPITVSFTIKDNKSAVTTAYYTTDSTQPTTSSQVYTSGDASGSGKVGPSMIISKSTNLKFLVRDAAGNETYSSFFYNVGPNTRSDFREESIYFLMTTRFFDGDSTNNRYTRADDKSGNKLNNDPPWRGDFKGLIDKLDYIKALGFTAIWITPALLNRSEYDYHGYHTWDFNQIDKRLESQGASYEDLVKAVHSKGMKLVQDIVLNHSSRYGIKDVAPVKFWGDVSDPQWGDGTPIDYYDVPNPNFVYNGLDVEPISGKSWYNGDLYQKEPPTLPWTADVSQWGLKKGTNNIGLFWYEFQWPTEVAVKNIFNPEWFHPNFLKNWEDETCQTGSIHEDCIDLDTESKVVQDYLINAYDKLIDMGVDSFRIDTVKHISRNTFNRRFIPAFKQRGGDNFYLFGEVCTRVNEVWNKGNAPLSVPFYTWKERQTYSADDHTAAHEAYTYEFQQGTANQPTSNNHYLNGNNYQTPDYSKNSGMAVIDFPMHWNFDDAGNAFRMKSEDKYYNDATWNVTYVQSHDYSPIEGPQDTTVRYNAGTDAWAENMTLLWTFRGIPCLFYGDEIEFKKGATIDKGPSLALEESGRAYFGKNIEGTVSVTDFATYTGATGAMATTLNHPLAKHLQRLNKIRRAIPALQKGQYSTDGVSGGMAFKRRFTDTSKGIDSFVLVTISGSATFTGIPNGTYKDAITGDTITVTGGSLTANCSGKGNARIYVLNGLGKIGEDGSYLK